jgi:hypothetical protein
MDQFILDQVIPPDRGLIQAGVQQRRPRGKKGAAAAQKKNGGSPV